MQTWVKRSMQTAVVTGGMLMLGAGIASAAEYCPDRPTTPLGGSITAPGQLDCKAVGTPLGQIHQLRSAHPLTQVIGFANRLPDRAVPGARPPISAPAAVQPVAQAVPQAPVVARRIEPSEWPTGLIERVVVDESEAAPSWVKAPAAPGSAPQGADLPPRFEYWAPPAQRQGWITAGAPTADLPPARAAVPAPPSPPDLAQRPDLPATPALPQPTPVDDGSTALSSVRLPQSDTAQPGTSALPRGGDLFFGGPIVPADSRVRGVQLPHAGPLSTPTRVLTRATDALHKDVPDASATNAAAAPVVDRPSRITQALAGATSAASLANRPPPPALRTGEMRPRLYPLPPALANLLIAAGWDRVASTPTADDASFVPLLVRGEGLPGPAALPSFPELRVFQASLAPPVRPASLAQGAARPAPLPDRVAMPTGTRVALPEIPVAGRLAMPIPPGPGDLPRVQLPMVGGAKIPGVADPGLTPTAVAPVSPASRFPELTAAVFEAQRTVESTDGTQVELPGPATLPSFPELAALRQSLATAIPMSGARSRSATPSIALPAVALPGVPAGSGSSPMEATQVIPTLPRLNMQLPNINSGQPDLQQNHVTPVPMH